MIRTLRAIMPRERPPNVTANRITGRNYLSHSQLSVMRACPRKFSFHYVEHTKPDFLPSSLLFGQSIHSAIELHFRCQLEGLEITPQALFAAYHQAWNKGVEEAGDNVQVRFNKNESAEQLSALAFNIISAFAASEAARPLGQIIGIEEEMRMVLDAALPDVLAKVDLVWLGNDALHVVDFKTSKSRWNEAKVQESAGQLLLYEQATKKLSESLDLPVKLHFVVLTKGKSPVVQLLDVPVDSSHLPALCDGIGQTWSAIMAGHFYPSPSPMTCCLCAFKSRCPVFKHG